MSAADYSWTTGLTNTGTNFTLRRKVTFKTRGAYTVQLQQNWNGSWYPLSATQAGNTVEVFPVATVATFPAASLSAEMPTRTVNSPAGTKMFSFRIAQTGLVGYMVPVEVTMDIPTKSLEFAYAVGSSMGTKYWDLEPFIVWVDATGELDLEDPELPEEPKSEELMMAIENRTGNDITIPWGNRTITLHPGQNLLRYDGPVDANGMPTVVPPGFRGSTTTTSDGTKWVGGIINKEPGGEFPYWMDPPVYPPTAPGTSPQWDIPAPVPPDGPRVVVKNPDGSVGIQQFPPILPRTPSNTTGGGAVISDPTQPKPPQTPGNTITNITNTTNTTVTNVTNINNYGDDKDDNSGAVNAIVPDGTVASDPAGTPSDAGAGVQSATGSFKTKFGAQAFQLLSQGSVPKIMSYTETIPLGNFGSPSIHLDFTQNPFPAVRMAMVAMMTLGFGLAFMTRITI